jgi:hypothetical protein
MRREAKSGSIGLLSTFGSPIIVSHLHVFHFTTLLFLTIISFLEDTVQRGFSTEPDQLSSSSGMLFSYYGMCFADRRSGQSAEAVILISSLRDVIRQQSGEIESLQKRLKEASTSTGSQVHYYSVQS